MSETPATRVTVPRLVEMKQKGERIVCVTAYDVLTGRLAEAAGVDLVLVGDSLGNVVLGYQTTLPVEVRDIAYHLSAVRRVVKRPLLVADMPFGSYGAGVAQAFESAVALMKAGAQGVKLEGLYEEEIAALWKAGIPVMGHLGMTPQSVNRFGGFKVQGKGEEGKALVEGARRLEDSGAFAIVLELVPAELAARVTEAVKIPTIGIGAGLQCDGEIQVVHDLLGLSPFRPKHAKRYLEGLDAMTEALAQYAQEVRERRFPGPENAP